MNTLDKTRGFTQWDLFAGILPAIACTPLLVQQLASLSAKPFMCFYPVTFLAFAVLLFFKAGKGQQADKSNSLPAAILLVLGVVALAAGALRDSSSLGHVAFVCFVGGWAIGRFRTYHWASPLGWAIFLASTIPLPRGWDTTVINTLYAMGTAGTAKILDALQITCVQHGASIEVPSTLVVGSNIAATWGSIFGLASFSLGLCAFRRRSGLVSALSLLLVPVWAWLGNVTRCSAIVVAAEWYGRDLSNGKDFLLLHVLSFALSAFLIALSGRFLANLFSPIELTESKFGTFFTAINRFFVWPGLPVPVAAPAAVATSDSDAGVASEDLAPENAATKDNALLSGLLPKIVGIAALLLMILPASKLLGGGLANLRFGLPAYSLDDATRIAMSAAVPPQTSSGWSLLTDEVKPQMINNRGQYSAGWRYSNREKQFSLLLELPHLGWVDPTLRWTQRGWEIQKEKAYTTNDWLLVESELSNELGDWTYMIYCIAAESGEPYSGAPEKFAEEAADLPGVKSRTAVTKCIQLIAEPGRRLTGSELAEYRVQLTELRDSFLSQKNKK